SGDEWGLATSIGVQGELALETEDHEAARSHLQVSIGVLARLNDVASVAYRLEGFARLAAARGESERALTLAGAAAAIWKRSGAAGGGGAPARPPPRRRAQGAVPPAPAAADGRRRGGVRGRDDDRRGRRVRHGRGRPRAEAGAARRRGAAVGVGPLARRRPLGA